MDGCLLGFGIFLGFGGWDLGFCRMGCTVGAVRRVDGTMLSFKTVDVRKRVRWHLEPVNVKGKKYRYLKFPVSLNPRKKGFWAGVNEKGLVVLGADANAIRRFSGRQYGGMEAVWEAYEGALGGAADVKEACDIIVRVYQRRRLGGPGDIVFVSDQSEALAIEYSLNEWGLEFIGKRPYLVRTNHFIELRHLRHSPDESSVHMSSATRYQRALGILSRTSSKTTVDDLMNFCRDHANGPSALSICRHGGKGEYRSVGAAVFEVRRGRIRVHFVNGIFPCRREFRTITFQ